MSATTNIEWATHTASPWFGCTEVSPGCANCYARQLTLQKKWAGWGDKSPRVRSKGFWVDAYRWNRLAVPSFRPRMFTSLMDWLDPMVPIEWLADFLKVVFECQNLDWLLLTKRPEQFRERVYSAKVFYEAKYGADAFIKWIFDWFNGSPPNNVWVGVTCENQRTADERLLILSTIPARVRWVSAEPLLETVQVSPLVDWVVIGGESGPSRRDCGIDAICQTAWVAASLDIPIFIKQDCAFRPGQQGRISDGVWKIKELPSL